MLLIHHPFCFCFLTSYDDGESGILGFLLESYKRPSDNLPVTGTIAFDATSFERLRRNGDAGTFSSNIMLYILNWQFSTNTLY